MCKIEVELFEDLESWLCASASAFCFTPGQMLEHLVRLESGLRREDALGRSIRLRDMIYRQLTPPGEPFAVAEKIIDPFATAGGGVGR